MGRMQRAKGARFERELVNTLKDAGLPARRVLQPQGGRVAGNDVLCGRYGIECKVGKLPNPRAALKQAIGDAGDCVPVAVIKDDRSEPFVVMRLSDWIELIQEVL